jgi:hypothetical protein
MDSFPPFTYTSVILEPSPSAFSVLHPLSLLNWGDNIFAFYWWAEQKKVIIWAQKYAQWLLQPDMNIRDSILDIVDLPGTDVELTNFVLYDGPLLQHAAEMPERMKELFLDCEWSDYACDHRPVTGRISIRCATVPASLACEDSLSDDDAPPSPRRWRRWESPK